MTSKWELDFSIVATSESNSKSRARQRSFKGASQLGQKNTSSVALATKGTHDVEPLKRQGLGRSKSKPKDAKGKQFRPPKSMEEKLGDVVRYARPSTAQGSRVSLSQRLHLKSKHSVSGITARVRRNPRKKELQEAEKTKWDTSCSLEYKQRLSQGIHNLHPSEVLDWITEVPEFYRSNREVAFIEQSDPEKRRARRMKHSIVCQTLNAPESKTIKKVVIGKSTRKHKRFDKACKLKNKKLNLVGSEPITGELSRTILTQQSDDTHK